MCTRRFGVLAAFLLLPLLSGSASAEDWVVSKSTGQVWHAPSNAQPVSLGADTKLAPGDLVQTGPTGRVMLTRGSERILVAPNSVISLPKTPDKPGFTTILQQAGAIAVEAEKKDHKHFEVLTPYLAAVVKGTQFTVTVGKGTSDVNVASGKVEVADVKSGKTALVLPGQFAKVGSGAGLTLGGRGTFEPIMQGIPRADRPAAVTVPRHGFDAAPKVQGGLRVDAPDAAKPAGNVVRIEKALGPITLDAGVATAGLIRSEGAGVSRSTIWKPVASEQSSSSTVDASKSGNGASSASATGLAASAGTGNGNGNGVNAGAGTSVAASAGGNGLNAGAALGNGNGNGNAFGLNGGNGNGHAFGLNGKPPGHGKKSN